MITKIKNFIGKNKKKAFAAIAVFMLVSMVFGFFDVQISLNNAQADGVNSPFGTLDVADINTIAGWTCDADNFNQSTTVHVYINGPYGNGGSLVGVYPANVTRPDVASACGGSAAHGFSIPTPAAFKDGNSHSVFVYGINIGATGQNQLLANSPKFINPVYSGGNSATATASNTSSSNSSATANTTDGNTSATSNSTTSSDSNVYTSTTGNGSATATASGDATASGTATATNGSNTSTATTNSSSDSSATATSNSGNNVYPVPASCGTNGILSYEEAQAALGNGQIQVTLNKLNANQATAAVTNNTDCALPVSLMSYKVFDNQTLLTQVNVYNTGVQVIPAHHSATLYASLAACLTQVDLYYGQGPVNFANGAGTVLKGIIFGTGSEVFYDIYSAHGTFCGVPTQQVSVSCSTNTSTTAIGSTVTYTANVTGVSGSVSYSWSGTDGLSGSSSSVSKSYSSSGSKSASVSVATASATATATCTTNVIEQQQNLAGQCYSSPATSNPGQTVNWLLTGVTGGNGTYTYSWSGDEGLSGTGSSASKAYSGSGTKNATVVISSGGQSITRNCTTYVNPPQTNNLYAYCSVNTAQANVGDTVTYTVHPTGGTGSYTYSWSGTDGLSGTSDSVSKSYSYAGNKNASVNVYSGGATYSVNCATNIIGQTYNNLGGSCYAVQSQANVGDTVTFVASPTGGNGNYSYSWSGTDGLSGNSQSISRSYSYPGTKNVNVTIYSDGQSITRNCSTQINQYNNNNNLNLYCSVNPTSAFTGDSVSWTAYATGGNGYYSYSWSGTDGLYGNGQSAYQSYNTPGTKYGYVTVYSGGQSVTRTCTISVMNRFVPPPVYYPPFNPGNTVSLSAVPYTGLDSNAKVILFTLGLSLWSAIVTYYVIVRRKLKKGTLAYAGVATSADAEQEVRQQILSAQAAQATDLESYARSKNVIISMDALESILAVAGGSSVKAQAILNNVAERYQGDNEWTTLNYEKVASVVGQ